MPVRAQANDRGSGIRCGRAQQLHLVHVVTRRVREVGLRAGEHRGTTQSELGQAVTRNTRNRTEVILLGGNQRSPIG